MMKLFKILILIFLPFTIFAQQGKTMPYKKKLPIISKEGIITMPDGKKVEIPNFNQKEVTIFFLIRHAEKDTAGGSNADLNPIGRGRAEALPKMFKQLKFHGIYATAVSRVQSTVAPLAKAKGQHVKTYDAKYQQTWINNLLLYKGKYIFIAGHSNTIPPLVNILKNENVEQNLEDQQYGCMYIVAARSIGDASVIKIYY